MYYGVGCRGVSRGWPGGAIAPKKRCGHPIGPLKLYVKCKKMDFFASFAINMPQNVTSERYKQKIFIYIPIVKMVALSMIAVVS